MVIVVEGVGEKEDRVWVFFEEDIKGEEFEVGYYVVIVNFWVKYIIVILDIFIIVLSVGLGWFDEFLV